MNYHEFAAIRGIQAEREYYVVMCSLKLIPRLFLFNERVLPAELRAQRTLNRARIPAIAEYLLDHSDNYVFSAITASVDANVEFQPEGDKGYRRSIGTLRIPMEAQFVINDGQHRRAAIEYALQENPDLGDESIAVVLFVDAGLQRSQQMFADLNKHAVRPTKSLSVLYDHRDPWAALAVDLVYSVPVFIDRTETEKTTISNRSTNLFTLHAIYQATKSLLVASNDDIVKDSDRTLALNYWHRLGEVIPEWRTLIQGNVSAATLRKEYVHSHGVVLQALGEAGAELVKRHPDDWTDRLSRLTKIDWRRSNTLLWEGRAMQHGRMSKARNNVGLTVNIIKQILDLPLSEEELELEKLVERKDENEPTRTS
ncbi:MAG: DNA sulfur modification protein DndB [Chloroflexi bacterium]|nr:MAG: DNA sulfur modification protein DndB [Chloroflexota bacterium]